MYAHNRRERLVANAAPDRDGKVPACPWSDSRQGDFLSETTNAPQEPDPPTPAERRSEQPPRNYAGWYLFVVHCLSLAASISLIFSGRFVLLGIVFALFALVEGDAHAIAILYGPTLDASESERLFQAINRVTTTAGLGELDATVYVQTHLRSPLRVVPPRFTIVAETTFVRELDDAELHAVSGYLAACYFFPPSRALIRIYGVAGIAVSAAIVLAEVVSGSALLGLAMTSCAVWLAALATTALVSARTARAFRDTDSQAAALLGDCAEAALALNLVGKARTNIRLSEPRFRRLLFRCIQPIAPSGHEDERGRIVCSAPVPPVGVPKRRVRPAPPPSEPQYEP